MEKTRLVSEALALITELDRAFQADKRGTVDEERFQYNLTETEQLLESSTDSDNQTLIALDKFYRATSFLVGLGNLHLGEVSKQAWRDFDRFYYQEVRDQLKVYGGAGLSQV